MCENGSGTENEIHYKQNKVYDSNDSQRKEEVLNIRASESREYSKNHQIQILTNPQ